MAGAFGIVDQALVTLQKVEQYISAGMETTTEVSLDLVEHQAEDLNKKVEGMREIMLSYAEMERDLRQFAEAVKKTKQEALDCDGDTKWPDLNEKLDENLAAISAKNSHNQLLRHEKFVEMNSKIERCSDSDALVPVMETQMGDGEDFCMTQQEISTRCPVTGSDMVNPVRNRHCRHNYDKSGIEELLKQVKGRRGVKCPVAGCSNDFDINMADLEPNKELKKYIEAKKRQEKKNKR